MASRLELGVPLNKFEPNLPGNILNSPTVNTLMRSINGAGSPPGNNMGQKGADNHSGTIRVPCALQLRACWITRGIRKTGGQSQLLSATQLQVNESTASDPGF